MKKKQTQPQIKIEPRKIVTSAWSPRGDVEGNTIMPADIDQLNPAPQTKVVETITPDLVVPTVDPDATVVLEKKPRPTRKVKQKPKPVEPIEPPKTKPVKSDVPQFKDAYLQQLLAETDEMTTELNKNLSRNDSNELTTEPETVNLPKIEKIEPTPIAEQTPKAPVKSEIKLPTQAELNAELTNAELERSQIVTPKFVRKNNGEIPNPHNSTKIQIGRKSEFNDYAIPDNPKVSSVHLKLYKDGKDWFVEDLKSTNGTRLNGIKLNPNQPEQIHYGDVITFAGETITYDNGGN
jgi:pSer/pThr/pTyr-binding forkhead associated (FHA) protein